MPCDSVARNSALIPMVSHALPRVPWALISAKRLDAVGDGRREAFGVRQLAAALLFTTVGAPGPVIPRPKARPHTCLGQRHR
ncbi:MAG: hypothetical protein GX456_07320 [Verrucomicrobia bacterium]|nr:hypothetical protein [Verrucomicrobiota bacterium]